MSQKAVTTLVAIVILLIWGFIFGFPESDNNAATVNDTQALPGSHRSAQTISTQDDAPLTDSYEQKRSKVWMEIGVEVTRLLADDNEGSRHQKFIAQSSSGHTILVSHNIDLADRAPIAVGAEIRLRGRYEWNDQGGVIHWTHHDPRGKIEGGWIEVNGEIYR